MTDQFEAQLWGTDLFGAPVAPEPSGVLAKRFTIPPFSVLDARSGDWQARKRAWLSLGLKSEVGRDAEVFNITEWMEQTEGKSAVIGGNQSIFDPVLCELTYRWWLRPAGQIVDPFAGGSVRGVVAGILGHRYWGTELRAEQVAANIEQHRDICPGALVEWVCADAAQEIPLSPPADLIFSCPPYGNLERYSDDPQDLSNMEYPKFIEVYREIIRLCAARMREHSFAVFVVGDFRDKRGNYHGFVKDTVDAWRDTGVHLYNDAILAVALGTLPVRAAGAFAASRKLGKGHQNVLVFVKGDPKKAAGAWVDD